MSISCPQQVPWTLDSHSQQSPWCLHRAQSPPHTEHDQCWPHASPLCSSLPSLPHVGPTCHVNSSFRSPLNCHLFGEDFFCPSHPNFPPLLDLHAPPPHLASLPHSGSKKLGILPISFTPVLSASEDARLIMGAEWILIEWMNGRQGRR